MLFGSPLNTRCISSHRTNQHIWFQRLKDNKCLNHYLYSGKICGINVSGILSGAEILLFSCGEKLFHHNIYISRRVRWLIGGTV